LSVNITNLLTRNLNRLLNPNPSNNHMSPQSLESFLHLDRIDIGRLTIENPKIEKELPFDAERDISEEDREIIEKDLNQHRAGKQWKKFAIQAMRMKFLFPQHQIELGLESEVRQGVRSSLDHGSLTGRWRYISNNLMCLKLIFPQHQAKLELTESVWQGVYGELRKSRVDKKWEEFFDCATPIKILFPQRQTELGLDEEAWQEMIKKLDRFRILKSWGAFAYYAMHAKLLFSSRQAELEIDEKDWEGMLKELNQYYTDSETNDKWGSISDMAFRMQILSAEEAYINDQGELVINMRKPKVDLHQERPPMPVLRKF